jgi:hypothetical protein
MRRLLLDGPPVVARWHWLTLFDDSRTIGFLYGLYRLSKIINVMMLKSPCLKHGDDVRLVFVTP